VRLAGQAKGAGMISPRFATMFCFVETDALVEPATIELLTGVCVKRSFDRISVDGQLSTSDTVFALANGASGVRVEPESPDELALGEALDALMRQLALEIVADGEGATRVGRAEVVGAKTVDEAERVARAIANSPLVKTALFGRDSNWGRIAQAAGMALAGEELDELGPDRIQAGELASDGPEAQLSINLGRGKASSHVYFSDLTHDYIRINAEYTT
jgi:glutamate N-acetyltransferase/amino-acid N-acetyltransferase